MAQQSYKKFVATAATASLVASALVPVASASANVNTAAFTDVGSSYKDAVEFVVSNNIAKGLTETQFGINNQIKRGDVAIMIANAAGLNDEKAPAAGFSDVPKRGALAINSLKAAGVISGKTDTKFGFEDNVTRGEAALMLQKAFKLEAGDTKNSFSDVSDRYDAAVDALVANKVTSGINKTQFGTTNPIKRGDFAKFLYALKDQISPITAVVSSVAVTNPTTLTVKLKEAKQGLVAADFSVVVDGSAVLPTGVVADSSGETYTLTIPSLDGKAGTVAVNKVEAAYNFAKNEVTGVSAINASEVQVTFSKDVDVTSATKASNYDLKINDVRVTDAQILDIDVDGKTATLLLDSSAVSFQSGDAYVIQTNNSIKTKDGKEFAKYVSEEKTFSASAAPALKDVKPNAAGLQLTFDRPVDASSPAADVTLIKVDGVAITSKDLKPATAKIGNEEVLGSAGSYIYNVALTTNELKKAKEVGNHEVVIFDVKETASAYAKVASVLSGTYTVTDSVVAPEVTGIEAVNANKFFLYTNTPVVLSDDTKLTVVKGTHEFPVPTGANKYNTDTVTNATSAVDAYASTYKGKDGVFVVVTDAADTDENPLYKNNESQATLTATLENYTASGIVGKTSTKTVTLNKNNSKPEIADTKVDGNDLKVTFNHELGQLADGKVALTTLPTTDFIVRDKDGVIVSPSGAATVSGKVVTVPLAKTEDGPYTVEFKADKFRNLENITAVTKYLVNTLKNDKLVASVEKKDENFKYSEFKFAATPEANAAAVNAAGKYFVSADNEITFQYASEMSDSARNPANYKLDGKTLPAGSTVDFVGDKKTVRVTLPAGTLKASTDYKFGISTDVTTAAGSHIVGSLQTKAPAEKTITLADNIKPELKSAAYLIGDENVKPSTTTNQIEVTFSENLSAIADNANSRNDFKVVVNGATIAVTSVTDGTVNDDKLVLTLGQSINVNQASTISIVPEDQQDGDKEIVIKDIAGNKASTAKSITVTSSKYSATLGALAASKTALSTAINTATEAKNGVVTSTDGTDVAPTKKWVTQAQQTTFDNAITAAQSALDNATTASAADSAKTTLDSAVTTYNGQKQAGTQQ